MKDFEREHIQQTKFYIGCLPCLLEDWFNMHPDYHHVVEGRKRLGHMVGFGMCLWHHRGEVDNNWKGKKKEQIEALIGPSFARSKKVFIGRYGPELLLVRLNDFALSLWGMTPWIEHCMSLNVGEAIQAEHKKLMEER